MTTATVAGIAFSAAGLWLLTYALWAFWYSQTNSDWPATDGEVAVSDLQRDVDRDGATYRAEVAYKYRVGDREFVADRVFFGDGFYTSFATGAVREVERYRAGTPVRVRYDPAAPQRAVLEPGTNGLVYLHLVLGNICLGVGVVALLGGFGS